MNSIQDALWSCYLHGYAPGLTLKLTERPPGERPGAEKLRVVALEDALKALTQDESEHRDRNLARAAQQLAKGGFFSFSHSAASLERRSELAPLMKGLLSDLRLADDVVAKLTEAAPQDAGNLIAEALESAELELDPCPITNRTCTACYNATSGATTVTATGTVSRPITDMPKVIDPQNWHHCSEAFEDSVSVVEVNAGGTLAGYYNPSPNPSGVPWSGMLYEKVDGGGTVYENVLWINYTQSPPVGTPNLLRVEYSLKEPYKPNVGELRKDEGHMTATRHSFDPLHKTDIEIVKTVRFADFTPGGGPWDIGELPNYYAPALLCLWLDDQLYLGPCCSPP